MKKNKNIFILLEEDCGSNTSKHKDLKQKCDRNSTSHDHRKIQLLYVDSFTTFFFYLIFGRIVVAVDFNHTKSLLKIHSKSEKNIVLKKLSYVFLKFIFSSLLQNTADNMNNVVQIFI